jgi:hypothetical protein
MYLKKSGKFAAAGCGVLLASMMMAGSSEAGWNFDRKVIDVSQTSVTAGSVTKTTLTVKFDAAVGSGCTDNTVGAVTFASDDQGNLDVYRVRMESVRQLATAALLSGRKVNVQTNDTGCTPEGWKWILWFVLK